jgi:hypothetical protein
LPVKFNIDKRKVEYSALIRSGQRSREDVLEELQNNYPFDIKDVEYIIKKLGFSKEEWEDIMTSPRKTFKDYKSYYPFIRSVKFPLKIAAELRLIPKILYEKYAKM